MLVPRRPRRALSAPAASDRRAPAPAREGQLLSWFAELVQLTEQEGHATARLWYERMRGPGHEELSRASANRQWERLKVALVEHGVPHDVRTIAASDDTGEGYGACAIVMRVSKTELHRYTQKLKRCAAVKTCGKRFPPRAPFFHRDPTRPDGLSRRCAECERAARTDRHRKGLAEGVDPRQVERRRTSARVAMAARRARLKKLQRDASACAVSASRLVMSHESARVVADAESNDFVKSDKGDRP